MVPLLGTWDFPRIAAQLWPDTLGGVKPATAGSDCAVMCTQAQVAWGTNGTNVPPRARIRTLAGVASGGLSSSAILNVLKHFQLQVTKLADFTALEAALADPDKLVSVAWDNGFVNATYPWMSGDLHFNLDHRVLAWGTEVLWQDGPVWHVLLDPTHDGRTRDGVKLPKGPMMIKRAWLQDAMVATGYFSAIAVTR